MASQSQGIQQLLQAEKRAAEKVAEARKREYGPPGLALTRLRPCPLRGEGELVGCGVAGLPPQGSEGRW